MGIYLHATFSKSYNSSESNFTYYQGYGDHRIRNIGFGGPSKFMKKYFGDSCLPKCGHLEKMFHMIVRSDADCPAEVYFDHFYHLLPEVAVPREEYCESEVRHNGLKSFLRIYVFMN